MITQRIIPKIPFLILSFSYCSTIIFAQSQEKIIDICPRVGDTIDRYEKEYFGLFPKIDDFDSAQIVIYNKTDLYCKIQRFGFHKADTLLPIKNFELTHLSSYLMDFEDIVPLNRGPGSKWYPENQYKHMIDAGWISDIPIRINEPVRVHIVMKDYSDFPTYILSIFDSSLLISDNKFTSGNRSEMELKRIRISEIDSIYIMKKSGFFWPLAGLGFIVTTTSFINFVHEVERDESDFQKEIGLTITVGGLLGAAAGGVLGFIGGQLIADKEEIIYSSSSSDPPGKKISDLKKYSQFPELVPPELRRFIEEK